MYVFYVFNMFDISHNKIFYVLLYYIVNNSSFSCGFSLFYWPWFAEEHEGTNSFVDGDIFDYYKQSELYVKKAKYNNLKEEILLNTGHEISDTKIWNENVASKATQFMDTPKVKSIKFNEGRSALALRVKFAFVQMAFILPINAN